MVRVMSENSFLFCSVCFFSEHMHAFLLMTKKSGVEGRSGTVKMVTGESHSALCACFNLLRAADWTLVVHLPLLFFFICSPQQVV